MKKRDIHIKYDEYSKAADLNTEDRALVEAARKAANDAYAPYSEFKVGAALLLQDGTTVIGNNQENAAYPSGLCAERVALFAASAQHPGIPVRSIAIAARSPHFTINTPVSPCGACRQVMAEYQSLYKKPIRLLLTGEKGKVYVLENVNSVLPFLFDASQLKK
jgi:cytidine deaminase